MATDRARSRSRDVPQLDGDLRRVIVVVMVGTFLAVLDTTITNVAIHKVSVDLASSLDSIQWVVTGYLLALATVIPLSGWIGRRVGMRRAYLISLTLFIAGSALCGAAWSTESLIVFRVIQGFGGGMLVPVGQMIVARAAGPGRIGRATGAVAAVSVLAPIVGPVVGGLIVTHWSWRWIFYVNLPVGALAATLAIRILPSVKTEPADPFDWIGFMTLVIGLPAFTYGLAAVGEGIDVASPQALAPLAGGVALIVYFVAHALRVPRPLLDLRLLSRPIVATASLALLGLSAGVFGPYLLMPLFLQTVRGASALGAGLVFASQGVGAAIGINVSSRLVDRIGAGGMVTLGAGLLGVMTIPFAFFDQSSSYLVITATLLFRGVGIGISMIPTISAALAAVKPEEISHASPQLNLNMRVGGSLATAGFAVVLSSQMHTLIPHGAGIAVRHAMAIAYQHTYVWVLVVNAVTIIPAVLLWRCERRRRAPAMLVGVDERPVGAVATVVADEA